MDGGPVRAKLLLAVILALVPAPALAEPQAWGWLELRMPLSGEDGWPRTFRFVTEDNGYRLPGGGQLVYRLGPIWELSPLVSLATNLTTAADPGPGGTSTPDYAVELEPTIHGPLGPFQASYRNRLESRWLVPGHDWRDRHMVRLNWPLTGLPLTPYVWNELFVDLSGEGINQNRAVVGVGYAINPKLRLDLGFMLRSTRAVGADWVLDQVANIVVVYAP
ncbi:MAG: hypothetical protein JWM80_3493 [Cyanobacteria bacterium RYN_339]|nr:hypothetical protein [Cyanobacteria bacterium RYN_339]